ncbi:LCP family protein [Thermoproteota archaeon]
MINLGLNFKEAFSKGQVETATIPGAPALIKGVSYWRPDLINAQKIIESTLLGFEDKLGFEEDSVKTDATVEKKQKERRKLSINEVARITKQVDFSENPLHDFDKTLIVEVLNGYGGPAAAQISARVLKNFGVKVVRFGNAGNFSYNETLIVDWKGQVVKTLALAKTLSIDPSRIIVYDKPEKSIDVTLVLGHDWEGIKRSLSQ